MVSGINSINQSISQLNNEQGAGIQLTLTVYINIINSQWHMEFSK